MGPAARIAAVLPVIAALGWSATVAIDAARSDHLVREASAEMASWDERGARPAAGTWDAVRERLDTAARIQSGDPTLHELRGLLGSMRTDDSNEVAAGIRHLVKSLELRPVSPHAWANLAEAQYRRGEPGRNMELAFSRAALLGPSEPGVQRTVGNYGLAVWDEIGPSGRRDVEQLVAAGFRRNPLEMLQISERRGRLDVACRHLDGWTRTPDSRWAETCRNGRQP